MSNFTIDINCDLGEGVGKDHLLMPHLSSCNIACGSHAGDEVTMEETIALALEHTVKIGAHPSFPDRENFGRTEMHLPPPELSGIISDQVNKLNQLLKKQNGVMHHIKPHGALYNMAAINLEVAEAVAYAVSNFPEKVFLYVPYGSAMEKVALSNGIPIKYEVFADRNYNDDLTLVSRKLENALIKDVNEIFEHVVPIITEGKVKSISKKWVPIKANTLCIHGDNPNAALIVRHLSKKLNEVNISIE